jgi:hypothetical protein
MSAQITSTTSLERVADLRRAADRCRAGARRRVLGWGRWTPQRPRRVLPA